MGSPLRKRRDAQSDDLSADLRRVESRSPRQTLDLERLSPTADAANESVEELTDSDQSLEAAAIEGVEDAADHPLRPAHTRKEYGRPDDVPPLQPKKRS